MDRRERLGDPEESLRLAMDDRQASIWTALPGIVASVNLTTQTLSVQPAIQGILTAANGSTQAINMPLLVDVPIVWPRAGGFALTFPIAAGDEVLVVFASRCIDSWWQSGGVGAQAEIRMHDLSDGFAILAPSSQAKVLANVSGSNAQLRTESGATVLEITPGGNINLTAETEITLTAPTITMAGSVNMNGINFNNHKHTGVQPGIGTSGGPTN